MNAPGLKRKIVNFPTLAQVPRARSKLDDTPARTRMSTNLLDNLEMLVISNTVSLVILH